MLKSKELYEVHKSGVYPIPFFGENNEIKCYFCYGKLKIKNKKY